MTVDLVIFTLREDRLQLLLIERGVDPYQGQLALPGGFVRIDEGLIEAAQRELHEETGVSHAYLEKVGAFGYPERDPRERMIQNTLAGPGCFHGSAAPAAHGDRIDSAAAYRKGYEDALSAMHKAVAESKRTLLKTLVAR